MSLEEGIWADIAVLAWNWRAKRDEGLEAVLMKRSEFLMGWKDMMMGGGQVFCIWAKDGRQERVEYAKLPVYKFSPTSQESTRSLYG